MSDRLTTIDTHDAVFLLRHCYAIPKMMYFIRSSPCFKYADTLALYDEELRLALAKITNGKIQDEAWVQGCLPVANGALGIRSATVFSLSAFLSSAFRAQEGMKKLLPTSVF